MTASERIRDLAIRHGIYLERYTRGEAKRIIAILEQSVKDITRRIEATGGDWTRQRLNAVLDNTRAILREAFGAIEPRLFSDIEALASQEAEKALRDLSTLLPARLETRAPDPAQLLAAVRGNASAGGATMAELYGQWSANTQQAFVQAIRLGVAQGETVQQMIVRVRGSATGRRGVYAGGILQTTTRGAEAMVRTAVAHVNHEARQATYAENEDLFSGYQYVATLDAATCLVCGPLDGKVYAVGENIPLLPQHYNCRCVLIPIVKSWKELGFDRDELPPGTRASMDGQVPEKTTYADWLGRQSEALQNEILGKGRAELFRAGTPIDDMRSDRGRILTLQELREVDN